MPTCRFRRAGQFSNVRKKHLGFGDGISLFLPFSRNHRQNWVEGTVKKFRIDIAFHGPWHASDFRLSSICMSGRVISAMEISRVNFGGVRWEIVSADVIDPVNGLTTILSHQKQCRVHAGLPISSLEPSKPPDWFNLPSRPGRGGRAKQ